MLEKDADGERLKNIQQRSTAGQAMVAFLSEPVKGQATCWESLSFDVIWKSVIISVFVSSFFLVGWLVDTLLPVVEAAALQSDLFTKQLDRIFSGELQNHLVFFLTNRIYFFSAPTPSTI